jgi:hypothetical protein
MTRKVTFGKPYRSGRPIPLVERVHLTTAGSMTYNEWCAAAKTAAAMGAYTKFPENVAFYREKARRYADVARTIRAKFLLRAGVFYAVVEGR